MTADKETVYLMDASAFIHRSFHALGEMSTRSGQPTGAVFGFTNTLLKLLKDNKPQYLGVIYDSRGPTRRHGMYPEYKANRPPMDPRLASQQADIREMVRALGLNGLEKQGYEADDVIASLCRLAVSEGRTTVIVSGDKDFYQLLSPGVSMYDPDPKKNSAMDLSSFKTEFNIEPEAFLDVQALMGDNTDNIPGVPGVGIKTALKLIADYGSLDNLYQNLAQIKQEKLRQKLSENEESARLSRKLAKLGEGLEPFVTIAELKPALPDLDSLYKILSNLELFRILKDIKANGPVWLDDSLRQAARQKAEDRSEGPGAGPGPPDPTAKQKVTRLFGPGSAGYVEPISAPEDSNLTLTLVDGSDKWAELEQALSAAAEADGSVGLLFESDDDN
ncbi:MAG: hypothetical protein LBS44_01985, partial [Deltaproteobacteria bacterium]|nr:hypothetical protein [Deltaproteobacteria bacterium]